MTQNPHKAGFVHIIGKPNVGKSTLFNTLIKNPLSIITPKPQTTRQQIIGIDNKPAFQIIYVDTPGYIQPKYALQKTMISAIHRAIPGTDLLLWVVDGHEKVLDDLAFAHLKHPSPIFLLINKIDLLSQTQLSHLVAAYRQKLTITEIIPISARHSTHITKLKEKIRQTLPYHPAYYDKKDITDRPVRFFAAEIIRKAIFLQYQQEIPYSTQVTITAYKEEKALVRIEAMIYTERLSQKKILIGKNGLALKKVGIAARQELAAFLDKKVFLSQHVKILPHWRKKPKILQKWGYV